MNLKTNKTYVSFLLSFLMLFASCSQYDTIDTNSESDNGNDLLRKGYSDERQFTDEQLDEIAEWHNYYAEIAISNLDATSPNISEDVKNVMTNIKIPEFTKEHLEEFYEKYSNLDINSIKKNFTPEVAEFFGRMEIVINNAKHYNDIERGFNQIEEDTKRELKGTNVDLVLVLLKVGKNSAKLWMPKDIGGNGIGDDFLQSIDYPSGKKAPGWAVIMVNDMMGALLGVSEWALGLLIFGGPASLGLYLLAIGFNGAVASIQAAMP